MQMSEALTLLEEISVCQKAITTHFEPFKRHEHMQDYPNEARAIIRLMVLLADAQGEAIQLLRGAK